MQFVGSGKLSVARRVSFPNTASNDFFSGIKTWLTISYVSTFALISPVGTGIGIALSETVQTEAALQNSLVTVLQGLATGTLLYVVFFEVIEKEREKGTNGILQVRSLVQSEASIFLLTEVQL